MPCLQDVQYLGRLPDKRTGLIEIPQPAQVYIELEERAGFPGPLASKRYVRSAFRAEPKAT